MFFNYFCIKSAYNVESTLSSYILATNFNGVFTGPVTASPQISVQAGDFIGL